MDETLMNMCDLLMANFETLCRNYKLEETMNIAGAMILTNEHETADIERMKACYNIIKRSEGIFSVYRNYMRIPVMTKMSMSDDPENYFENLKAIKDELDRERFLKSEYSVIAAMVLLEEAKYDEIGDYIEKTKAIYNKMKEEHSVLTSSNDTVFAALLAISDIDVDNLLLEMEESYRLIKGKILFAESQEISHILSLDMGSPGLKAEKFLDLYRLTKENHVTFGSGTDINALAALSLLDLDNREIIRLVSEMEQYLGGNRYFRGLHMMKSTRVVLAGMQLMKYCRPDDTLIDNIILYSCLAAAIAATAAAAAAA